MPKTIVHPRKVTPITPAEVLGVKAVTVPEGALKAWNEIITENYVDGRSHFTQKQLVDRILKNLKGVTHDGKRVTRFDIFDKGWLDLEDTFRQASWNVEYDKPGFNENYAANFTFTPKRGYSRHTE
jgi:hypothetical protein